MPPFYDCTHAWLVLITQDKPLQTPVLDALEQRLEHLTSESHPLLDFRLALSECIDPLDWDQGKS